MARLPRLVAPGRLHLVLQRSHGAQPMFSDDTDRRLYLDALAAALHETRVAVHGYGLLDGEVRLLLTPPDAPALARLMQSSGLRFARPYNLRHQRRGSPWEGRFRSTVVDADEHFLACLRFTEGTEGGAALALGSSTAHHLGTRVDTLVTEHGGFWALGNTPFEREAAYRRLIGQPLPAAQVQRVTAAALNGWVLGSADYAALIESEAGRRTAPRSRGRPRKIQPMK